MSDENLIFMDRLIKDNPNYFKQGIIAYCRKLDKYDVYEWVATDELKINQLQQENQQLKDNWNELKKWLIKNEQKSWDEVSRTFDYTLDKMKELEGKSE